MSHIQDWLQSASEEDKKLALEIGAEAIIKIRGQSGPAGSSVPVLKGQIGEKFVENILRKKYGEISNLTKTSKSGDLNFYFHHRKIMVEVKNYANTVPTAEVEKFVRDLGVTCASAGIFISLHAPIAKISGAFTFRFDSIDGRVIPCIYMVGSDEKTIATAADMISHFVTAAAYLDSELYAKDKVSASTRELSDELSKLSRAKNELQISTSNIVLQLNKVTCSLSTAESNMGRAIENIRRELFTSARAEHNAILAELAKNQFFAGLKPDLQEKIGAIINGINGQWVITAKNCTHSTGVGFNFLARTTSIVIPIDRFADEILLKTMKSLGKKVSIKDLKVEIDFDPDVFGLVDEILTAK